jgi:hypothetical protein
VRRYMAKPVNAHPQTMAIDVTGMFEIARTAVDSEEATPKRLAKRPIDPFISSLCVRGGVR